MGMKDFNRNYRKLFGHFIYTLGDSIGFLFKEFIQSTGATYDELLVVNPNSLPFIVNLIFIRPQI